jgi:hypothetical protein
MGAPSPPNGAKAHEIPIVLHETAEFDATAPKPIDGEAVGGLTRCERLHALTEFDCSQEVGEKAPGQAAPET